MNKCILMGNITHDLELKQTPNGVDVLSFSIAVNDQVKKGDTWENEATFINIVAWGTKANTINKYFSKGSKILIEGKIRNRSWEAQDGTKRYKTEVILIDFEFTSSTNNSNSNSSTQNSNQSNQNSNQINDNEGISVDDLPF